MIRKASCTLVVLSVTVALLQAQTVVKVPKNNYTPEQDVELGRKAADEVRQQYPIIDNAEITGYLTMLGDRLVAASPADLKKLTGEALGWMPFSAPTISGTSPVPSTTSISGISAFS